VHKPGSTVSVFGVAGFRLIRPAWRRAGRVERAGRALEGRRRAPPARLAWWWRVPAG
jgi:hypothetical protein